MLSVAPGCTPKFPSSSSVPVCTLLVPPVIVKPKPDEIVNVPFESPTKLTPLICESSGSFTVPPLVIVSEVPFDPVKLVKAGTSSTLPEPVASSCTGPPGT